MIIIILAILISMKPSKDFLRDSGLDYETYKQCAGISTRSKPPLKKDQIS